VTRRYGEARLMTFRCLSSKAFDMLNSSSTHEFETNGPWGSQHTSFGKKVSVIRPFYTKSGTFQASF